MVKPGGTPGKLDRSLGIGQLLMIGIVMVQPTAPMPPFGIFYEKANGQVILAILLAMVAMLFTAVSYGKMARIYPTAGSAYTYVAREIHPLLGFATGWSLLLDYFLNPLMCVIWCVQAAADLSAAVPRPLWVVLFAALFTLANLGRIGITARLNTLLLALMGIVIAAMLVISFRYVLHLGWMPAGYLSKPLYDPRRFSWVAVRQGTSLAVLNYLGFDGLATLSEETRDATRNILRAMVLTCLVTGGLSVLEVYAAQLVWPAGKPFAAVETAYIQVAQLAGGLWFGWVVSATLLLATIGSGVGAQLSGARLLFGMGRSEALPKRWFGQLSGAQVPAFNVLLIGMVSALGALLMSYESAAELLNFGALFGFMGVNISAFVRFYLRRPSPSWPVALAAIAGFFVCLAIWWNLSARTKTAGVIWLGFGITLAMIRSKRLGGAKRLVFQE